MKLKYPLLFLLVFVEVHSALAQSKLWGLTSAGVADNKGVVFNTNADGTGYAVQHTFVTDFPGATPMNALTLANGKLYGLTSAGGANDVGILFEYDPASDTYTKKFDFSSSDGSNPQNGLVLASNGLLYGMTTYGGANGFGVLFEYDPVGDVFTKRHDFSSATDGDSPQGNLVQAANGKLYGMTPSGGANGKGTLFEYDPTTFTFVNKFDFTSASNGGTTPRGDLVEASGNLYGLTSAGGADGVGVLFEYVPGGTSVTKKVDFSSATTGANPVGNLTLSGGKLYGMTSNGGASNAGTLFEYVAGATTATKKFDLSSSIGANPQGSFVQAANGRLYALGFNGGATNFGTVFEYDPVGNTLTKKFDFTFEITGGNPLSNLAVGANGNLYGMNAYGGPVTLGTLFEYVPGATAITKKIDFSNSSNGSNPQGGLVYAPSNGFLYGMTSVGGANGSGVLFDIDPANSAYRNMVELSPVLTGASPAGSLVLATNSKLYGLTSSGGVNGDGVLFEYTPGTFSVTKRIDFLSATNGSNPQGSLVLASNGKMYGMTSQGGSAGNGVLFEYDPASPTVLTVKYSFTNYADGANPKGSLMLAANGKLYGMTNQGGTFGYGVVFEYDVTANTYTKKVDFTGANGQYPYGDLTQASNGKLYGMTSGGGANSAGVIFEFDPVAGSAAVKHDFVTSTTGSLPQGTLTEVAPGFLFGMTYSGGSSNNGVLFKYDISGGSVTPMYPFDGVNGANPQFESLLLVPGKQVQTITFNALPGKMTNDAPFGLTATASSGLPVSYTSSDPSIASISGSTVTIHSFGTVIITASQGGNAAFSFAQNVDRSLVISRASQTITFGPISATYGDAPLVVSPTASSGLAVSLTSSDPSIASVSGFTITILKAGTVNITASQPGNGTYEAAPDVVQQLVISKKNQTISFVPPAAKTYGDPPFTLVASATSGLSVTFSSPDPTISIVGNQVTILQAGSATITASQPGDANYNPAPTDQKIVTISQASQAITFGTLPVKSVGDAPFDLTGTSTSGLPLTYVSGDNTIATITGTTVTIWKAGTVNITASQSGNTNFTAANSVTQPLTINKGNQTITFGPLANKFISDAPFNLTATASSGLAITYVSSNLSVATISGSTVTIVGLGTTTITASQPGNSNYNAAPSVDQPLTVNNLLSQTITFNPLPAKTIGDNPFALTATASSGLPVSYTSSNTSVATISGTLVFIVGPGTTTITASQAGNSTYNAALDVNQNLVVNKLDQTITFGPIPTMFTSSPPFDLTATASSGLAVTYVSSNPSVATISGSTVTIHAAGTSTITASQPGNGTYNAAAPVNQPLTVTSKLPQTITFGPLTSRQVGDNPFALTASASSGLPVSYVSSNTSVATISGNLVFIVGLGTTTITASQPGDATYSAAPDVGQSLVVNKRDQTITFAPLPSKKVGDPPFALSATASSGLAVSYASSNPGVATVTGNMVTIVGLGTTNITATQAGNASFNAALPITQSLSILVTGDLPDPAGLAWVYPNPAREKVWLDLHDFSTEPVQISITDMMGRSFLAQSTGGGGVTEISVSDHPAGLYLLRAAQGDRSISAKYIKQ